jgi:hypothetical protein
VLTNINSPVPKVGQGVIQDGLQTLLFSLNDMHMLTLNIEEVTRYPNGLSIKEILIVEIF